jgi:hypothetical protein
MVTKTNDSASHLINLPSQQIRLILPAQQNLCKNTQHQLFGHLATKTFCLTRLSTATARGFHRCMMCMFPRVISDNKLFRIQHRC